jgi:hypothetical protein
MACEGESSDKGMLKIASPGKQKHERFRRYFFNYLFDADTGTFKRSNTIFERKN